uniref:Secreted protein n=1 Tax=Maylandia zebra TaxID=106582 RepID=A0A3P9BE26_9CICH
MRLWTGSQTYFLAVVFCVFLFQPKLPSDWSALCFFKLGAVNVAAIRRWWLWEVSVCLRTAGGRRQCKIEIQDEQQGQQEGRVGKVSQDALCSTFSGFLSVNLYRTTNIGTQLVKLQSIFNRFFVG